MCLVLPPWDVLLTLDAPGRRGRGGHRRWKPEQGYRGSSELPIWGWAGPAGATGAGLALSPRDEGLGFGLCCPLVATADTAGETGTAGLGLSRGTQCWPESQE